jgi:hypothetical protein
MSSVTTEQFRCNISEQSTNALSDIPPDSSFTLSYHFHVLRKVTEDFPQNFLWGHALVDIVGLQTRS